MPTPEGRFVNVSGVQFTPTGGTATPIQGVTNIRYDRRAQMISGSGDADMGPTSKNVVFIDPQIVIDFEKVAALRQLPSGSMGMLEWIQNDADNGEGTGALLYAVANCKIGNANTDQRHKQYGTASLTVETWLPDGRTNPVSITQVA